MPAQPTILVKKSDGTSVRMTMGEFKVYKNKMQDADNMTQEKPNLPMREEKMPVPATSAPVKKIFEDEARATAKTEDLRLKINNTKNKPQSGQSKNWTQVDNKPLLQEEVTGARKQEVIRTTLPDNRGDAFDQVIRNLKFPVRDELRPRLKSLIVSRVKDIRTDEQVREYAMQTVEKGGLGLSREQVDELLGVVSGKLKVESEKRQISPATAGSRLGSGTISNKIPNNKIRIPNSDNRTTNSQLPVTSYQLPVGGEKPVLHDVVAPVAQPVEQKVGMGPMEEFATFQMVDFRRLGDAVQAGEVMHKKFEITRTESLILYLRAIKAWRTSPIYQQYQKIITDAIGKSRPVKELVTSIGWKKEEFEEINKLCSSL